MNLELFINEVNEWVDLLAVEDFEELRDKAGDCVYVSDVDSDFGMKMEGNFLIEDLQVLQEELNTIEDEYDEVVFKALMEYCDDYEDAYSILTNYEYTYYPDVHNEDDLGYYVVDEGLWGEIPDNLVNYIDYEAIGRDIALNANGCFTDNGFIAVY